MSLLKFVVYWEEDSAICRHIEILSSHTYYDFHTILKTSFQLPEVMEASLFVSNNIWGKEKEISSIIEKNLRDAPALSMKRTPLGALINDPHQRFVYLCDHAKQWLFHLEITTLLPLPENTAMYPRCVFSEGLSPAQIGTVALERDAVVEIEERYDLNKDEEGFGSEGEDETSESDSDDSGADDNFTDDI
jgi:hypothetical protein